MPLQACKEMFQVLSLEVHGLANHCRNTIHEAKMDVAIQPDLAQGHKHVDDAQEPPRAESIASLGRTPCSPHTACAAAC